MTPQFILWGIPGFIAYYLLQAVRPARSKSGWDFVVEIGFLSLVCFAISRVLVSYVAWCFPQLATWMRHSWPADVPFALVVGIFPISELLGMSLARLSRHWWKLMSLYHEWITAKDKDFRFPDLFFSRTNELLSQLIFITLKSGKVYVGPLTAATHDPNESSRFISLVPILSGYRGRDDLRVVYTTFYEPDKGQDFLVPVGEITSLAKFDWDLLAKFYRDGNVTFDIRPPMEEERAPAATAKQIATDLK